MAALRCLMPVASEEEEEEKKKKAGLRSGFAKPLCKDRFTYWFRKNIMKVRSQACLSCFQPLRAHARACSRLGRFQRMFARLRNFNSSSLLLLGYCVLRIAS